MFKKTFAWIAVATMAVSMLSYQANAQTTQPFASTSGNIVVAGKTVRLYSQSGVTGNGVTGGFTSSFDTVGAWSFSGRNPSFTVSSPTQATITSVGTYTNNVTRVRQSATALIYVSGVAPAPQQAGITVKVGNATVFSSGLVPLAGKNVIVPGAR